MLTLLLLLLANWRLTCDKVLLLPPLLLLLAIASKSGEVAEDAAAAIVATVAVVVGEIAGIAGDEVLEFGVVAAAAVTSTSALSAAPLIQKQSSCFSGCSCIGCCCVWCCSSSCCSRHCCCGSLP